MNKDEWDNTYTERNAKAEMWGAVFAGFFFLIPCFLILAIWNPKTLFAIPILVLWLINKRITRIK